MRQSSNYSIDPLSDLLDVLQVRCALSGRLVAGGAWGRRFANLDAIKFCAATEGTCWYFMDGMSEPVLLQAGDVLVTNGTRSLTLASAPPLLPAATAMPLARDDDGQYRLGLGSDFAMFGGSVQIDEDRRALLLSCLPSLIHISRTTDEAAPISWLLGQLVDEMKLGSRPGRTVVISGLAQLLFVQTLRAYLAHASNGDEGWLKGFGDHKLAIALSRIHNEPARDWSLDELANEANMSRTSFAVRFRDMMGVPPLTYLTQWRMQLAKREMRAGASISEAAAKVGYSSESAFRNAFKRITDMAPGQYRRTMEQAIAEPYGSHDVQADL
jgi:AraC-like DNA-binding protein